MNSLSRLWIPLVVFTVLFAFSCSEEEKKNKPVENPFSDFLTTAGFTEITETVNSSYYEFGITFIPQTNGNMVSVTVKLPGAISDLRVTVWDAETETVLSTETIPTVEAGVEITQEITTVSLEQDKEYMITFNSNHWYTHQAADNSDATYPITAGNISVTGYGYIQTTDQLYPTSFWTNYYAGDLSFGFQPN